MQLSATIERAEKQIILSRHGRRLLNLLDDKPLVPGETRSRYENADAARRVLNDAERDLRDWQPSLEPVQSNAHHMGANLIPEASEEEMYTTPAAAVGEEADEEEDAYATAA